MTSHLTASRRQFGAAALAVGSTMFAGSPKIAMAEAKAGGTASSHAVRHHRQTVRGIEIHYRESGAADGPVLLLLHGFPTSSHMFRDLMPLIDAKYRVIAPDYPGFGYSSAPAPSDFDYSFANVADLTDEFLQSLGVTAYFLYMQDYGGPIGMRLAVKHPDRVRGMIVQNATFHAEGWNAEVTKPFGPFWSNRNAETEKPLRGFLAAATTQWQYTQGSTRLDRLSPDAWTLDQTLLNRPGNDAIMLQYLWNYQENLALYPAWQKYLGASKPPMLVAWGKNDPFFTLAGVEALKALVPAAKVELYDAGHFALETHAEEIAAATNAFLAGHAG